VGNDREMNYKLEILDLSQTGTVAHSGGTETYTIQPNEGFIYEVKCLYFYVAIPAGGTGGTQGLDIYSDGYAKTDNNWISLTQAHNSVLKIANQQYTGTNEKPTLEQSYSANNIVASQTYPVKIKYTNNTDADQTNTREVVAVVKKIREAL